MKAVRARPLRPGLSSAFLVLPISTIRFLQAARNLLVGARLDTQEGRLTSSSGRAGQGARLTEQNGRAIRRNASFPLAARSGTGWLSHAFLARATSAAPWRREIARARAILVNCCMPVLRAFGFRDSETRRRRLTFFHKGGANRIAGPRRGRNR